MAAHKHIDKICAVIAALTVLLTVLFMNGKALGISVIAGVDSNDEMFTQNDLDTAWDTAGATRIALSDSGSTVRGNGAYANGNSVYIVYAGNYVVSGNLSDGQIIVEADGDDKIRIQFDGVSIHCAEDAPLKVEQAGKVFLTLKEGTENSLSSGSAYDSEVVSANVDGVIYARDDLTINGGGKLTVSGEYQHGIVCNDDLVFAGGDISVTAPQDGIHANDSVRIKDSSITVSAGDDGVTVSNDDETAFFYMESGNISIPECCEGIEAVKVDISGGALDITPTDDGINANSYGGNASVTISGGNITISNSTGRDADGIDSNRDIVVSGGNILVSVPDDGISCALDYGSEYGGACTISGGTVVACGSSGMAEGFDSTSEQGFIMMDTAAEEGTEVKVKDSDGKTVISETVPNSFSSLLVSAPGMEIGGEYSVVIGKNETKVTIDNRTAGGGSVGGMKAGTTGMPGDRGFTGQKMNPRTMTGENGNGGFAGNTGDTGTAQGNEQQQIPQGFGSRPEDGNPRRPDGGKTYETQRGNNAGGTADQTSNISPDTMIPVGISAAVLLGGCVAAGVYRRRR